MPNNVKVFDHWIRGSTILDLFFDLALIVVSVVIAAMWVTSGLPIDFKTILIYCVILALTTLTLAAWLGLYDRIKNRSIYNTVANALTSFYIAAPIAALLFSLLPSLQINPEFLELSFISGMYGMLANRVRVLHSKRKPLLVNRFLIFGTGQKALDVQRSLEENDPHSNVLGFYPSFHADAHKVSAEKVLPVTLSLTETALAHKVDEIIVAVDEQRGGSMPMRALLDCKLNGIKVVDLATHFERGLGQIHLGSLRASWLIFGDGFNQGYLRPLIKRVFDVVCALILLFFTLPIMLVAIILIVCESGFPIIYRQERVGLHRRVFGLFKLRSMSVDAEKDGKAQWTSANDERINRVGNIIRKLHIDELPQLFNVLKGDMSLVGPRPERLVFVEQLTELIPFYDMRHSIKPGVTGWAQVRYHYGGSLEGAANKLQYDLYYVKHHNFFLDLVILFETIGVVMNARGSL